MFQRNLKKTSSIAILVGTVFFAMNQLPVLLAGQVTLVVVLMATISYLVPFCVSNYGVFAASREPRRQANQGCTT